MGSYRLESKLEPRGSAGWGEGHRCQPLGYAPFSIIRFLTCSHVGPGSRCLMGLTSNKYCFPLLARVASCLEEGDGLLECLLSALVIMQCCVPMQPMNAEVKTQVGRGI